MANEQQLIAELKQAGFNYLILGAELNWRMTLGLPAFALKHRKAFGKDTVDYEIHFRRINAEGEYRIDHYEAVYNMVLEIQHTDTNGINTFQLEDRMAAIDWRTLPRDPSTEAEVRDVIGLLWQLRDSDNINGFAIQQALCLKYWTGTPYDNLELQQHRKTYQTSRKFGNSEGELFNAFLCYYELSGTRQGIKDIFRRRGFNCDGQIDDHLARNSEFFEIHTYNACAEGLMHYRVPVRRLGYEEFLLPEYTATLVRMPYLESYTIQDVDTSGLEARMSAIDWSDPESYFIQPENGRHVYNSEVTTIKQLLLDVLPKDPVGSTISCQLQAKYWIASPDFYNLVAPPVFEYLQTLPYSSYDFPIDTHTKAASNLLCGRAVNIGVGQQSETSEDVWWKLEAKDRDPTRLFLLPFSSLSKGQLELLIRHIPASESELAALTSRLLEGDRAEVRLHTGKSIWAEVDAEGHTLKLTDGQGLPVQINMDMSAAQAQKPSLSFRPFLSEQERPAKGHFRNKRRP